MNPKPDIKQEAALPSMLPVPLQHAEAEALSELDIRRMIDGRSALMGFKPGEWLEAYYSGNLKESNPENDQLSLLADLISQMTKAARIR
jgi:hypothetical protein